MAKLPIPDIWSIVRELDLRPLRQQAIKGVNLAIAGREGSGRHTLAERLRSDPARPDLKTEVPVRIIEVETPELGSNADLIILMINSQLSDISKEIHLAKKWVNFGIRVLVFINQFDVTEKTGGDNIADRHTTPPPSGWGKQQVVVGSALDVWFLTNKFAPVVIRMLPHQLLALARAFPLFRIPVAHYLINDTCLSNAAYALSTGLAEIIPVLNLPLTVADMIILTKNQAYLVYKLGLAFGFSTRWQDYFAEFGGVLGGGFMWRQLARTLVGLIPIWGIVPKLAVAYSGTYVVGNVILQWYLTGRHISKKQMQQFYKGALGRGKKVARGLLQKFPRPQLPHKKSSPLLTSDQNQTCNQCGHLSTSDAGFCQHCGHPFSDTPNQTSHLAAET